MPGSDDNKSFQPSRNTSIQPVINQSKRSSSKWSNSNDNIESLSPLSTPEPSGSTSGNHSKPNSVSPIASVIKPFPSSEVIELHSDASENPSAENMKDDNASSASDRAAKLAACSSPEISYSVREKQRSASAAPQSRPRTRNQSRINDLKSTLNTTISRKQELNSKQRKAPSQSHTSDSDDAMVISRRPRRAAAAKARLLLSNGERFDRALSGLLQRAKSTTEYASVLERWRDPSTSSKLLDIAGCSLSSSPEESSSSGERLTSVSKKKRPRDSVNLSSKDIIATSTNTKASAAKTRLIHRANPSKSLETFQSKRLRSVFLRGKVDFLQNHNGDDSSRRAQSCKESPALDAPITRRKRQYSEVENPRRPKRVRQSRRNIVLDRDSNEDSFQDDGENKDSSSNNESIDDGIDADIEESDKDFEIGADDDGEFLDILEEESGSADDEANGVESADCKYVPKRKRKVSNVVKKHRGRRKRTAPSDVFNSVKSMLSVTEQRERLDFLVKQSADIARSLHQALAEKPFNLTAHGEHLQRAVESASTGGTKPDGSIDRKVAASLSAHTEEELFLPTGADCALQTHQTEGVNWLLKLDSQGLNAILADEMGLGKTIQALVFLSSLVVSGSRGPHLVIAPKSVCDHWVNEAKQWYPAQVVIVSHLGPAEERFDQLREILLDDSFDIMVTSYEIALRDLFSSQANVSLPLEYRQVMRKFRNVKFEYLVLDEAHRLKNDKSRINQAIRRYEGCQRRLLLTGTPLSNNLQELWSLMNILNPRVFSSKATFETWFSAPFDNAKGKRRQLMTNAEKSLVVDRLHTILRPFFMRRERKDVCPQYTSADEVVIACPLSSLQKALMHHFHRRASESGAGVTNILMAMRSVSNHPYTTTEAFNEYSESDANAKLIATSGKFCFLHYALPRLIASGHRVLIFSQFRSVLDYLEDLLHFLDIKFCRLDGATKLSERTSEIVDFNAKDSGTPVFLLTTRAGGVGLNLQTADTVILFDSDWNPSADLQAVSRIQRIGQKKTVHILRLVSDNSIDAVIVETADHKRKTQEIAVRAGHFHSSSGAARDQKLRQKDLEELLKVLDARKFLVDEMIPGSNSSPSDLSVQMTREARVSDWDKKLLRHGESALNPVELELIWVDSIPDCNVSNLPIWLSKDADLVAASRAMRCHDVYQALKIYEEVLQARSCIGQLSKKGRASRARPIYIELSSTDNEGKEKGDSDNSVVINSNDGSDSDDVYESDDVCEIISDKEPRRRKSKISTAVKQWASQNPCDSGLDSVVHDSTDMKTCSRPQISNLPNLSGMPRISENAEIADGDKMLDHATPAPHKENHLEPLKTLPSNELGQTVARKISENSFNSTSADLPNQPMLQRIALPMVGFDRKVSIITVQVQLDNSTYSEALGLSNEAIRLAILGNHTGAFLACSRISELLDEHHRVISSSSTDKLLNAKNYPSLPSPRSAVSNFQPFAMSDRTIGVKTSKGTGHAPSHFQGSVSFPANPAPYISDVHMIATNEKVLSGSRCLTPSSTLVSACPSSAVSKSEIQSVSNAACHLAAGPDLSYHTGTAPCALGGNHGTSLLPRMSVSAQDQATKVDLHSQSNSMNIGLSQLQNKGLTSPQMSKVFPRPPLPGTPVPAPMAYRYNPYGFMHASNIGISRSNYFGSGSLTLPNAVTPKLPPLPPIPPPLPNSLMFSATSFPAKHYVPPPSYRNLNHVTNKSFARPIAQLSNNLPNVPSVSVAFPATTTVFPLVNTSTLQEGSASGLHSNVPRHEARAPPTNSNKGKPKGTSCVRYQMQRVDLPKEGSFLHVQSMSTALPSNNLSSTAHHTMPNVSSPTAMSTPALSSKEQTQKYNFVPSCIKRSATSPQSRYNVKHLKQTSLVGVTGIKRLDIDNKSSATKANLASDPSTRTGENKKLVEQKPNLEALPFDEIGSVHGIPESEPVLSKMEINIGSQTSAVSNLPKSEKPATSFAVAKPQGHTVLADLTLSATTATGALKVPVRPAIEYAKEPDPCAKNALGTEGEHGTVVIVNDGECASKETHRNSSSNNIDSFAGGKLMRSAPRDKFGNSTNLVCHGSVEYAKGSKGHPQRISLVKALVNRTLKKVGSEKPLPEQKTSLGGCTQSTLKSEVTVASKGFCTQENESNRTGASINPLTGPKVVETDKAGFEPKSFSEVVCRLRNITCVKSTDLLVDTLLLCNCDLGEAVNCIRARSSFTSGIEHHSLSGKY